METIIEPVSPSPVRPNRGIYSPSDLEHFKKSDVYKEINNFVRLCGDSVIGKKISDGDNTSEIIAKLEEFVGDCSRSIDNYPPIEQPMRFGNKAFRQWLAHVQDVCVLRPPIYLSHFVISVLLTLSEVFSRRKNTMPWKKSRHTLVTHLETKGALTTALVMRRMLFYFCYVWSSCVW